MPQSTHTKSKRLHSKAKKTQSKVLHRKITPTQSKVPSSRTKTPPSNLKIAVISLILTAVILIPSFIISQSKSTQPVTLSPEYYLNTSSNSDNTESDNSTTHPTSAAEFFDLNSAAYEQLIQNRESFVVMVDNPGCVTTARMREYLSSFQDELPFTYYRMMWSEVQQSTLKNTVDYFPSLVIVRDGTPVYHLRADSDEDAPYYNDADALKSWLESRIVFSS